MSVLILYGYGITVIHLVSMEIILSIFRFDNFYYWDKYFVILYILLQLQL